MAFLMVFTGHYLRSFWGHAGVDFFFVLSGFLITGILYDTRAEPHAARNFYVRRALRIFPLYYGLLLVLLLTTPVFHWQWSAEWLAWPMYLGNYLRFLQPYSTSATHWDAASGLLRAHGAHKITLYLGHLWSLCVEEQFYLVWPAVVFLLPGRRRLLWICASVVVLLPFARAATGWLLPLRYSELEITYSLTPFRLDALLLGGLVALLLRGPERRWTMAVLAGFGRVCLPLLLGYVVWANVRSGYAYPSSRLTFGVSLVDLAAASLIALALRPGSLTYRVFSLQPLRWIGRVSYGAYVFHDIPHNWYARWAGLLAQHLQLRGWSPQVLTMMVALPGTLLLAWLSFRFVESPFLALKDRYTR